MISKNLNLDAFLAVCETGSISAAGKKLHLSQAGMTQRIQGLERELGVTVFTRGRRGMQPTKEGEFLLRYCQEARSLEGRLLANLQNAAIDLPVDITITTPASLVVGRFAQACVPIYQKWPNLNLRFLVDVNANRIGLLKRGTADFAVVLRHEVTPELDAKLLKPLEYRLVGPSAWAHRNLQEILEKERLFGYHPGETMAIEYLRAHGFTADLGRQRLYVNDNQALVTLIELGVGFGLLPKELVDPQIASGALAKLHGDKTWPVEFALTWYARNSPPPYFSAIIHALE